MNRKQREAARARYDAQAQSRSARDAHDAENRAKLEASLVGMLAGSRHRRDRRYSGAQGVVAAKAPRLFDVDHGRAVTRLLALPALRAVDDWSPRGKGRDSLFRSLAAHCLAKYPTPAIVWNAFHEDNADALVALAAHVAGGGSLYELVKSGFFAIPLTRKMCHDVLATPAEHKLLQAIRRTQARTAGCDPRFFDAWMATPYAQRIGTRCDETFWSGVLSWFANVGMLDPAEVGPLYDYIDHRRREDATFTLKGRSCLALMRLMKEWHGNLTKEKAITGKIFTPSGFGAFDGVLTRNEARGVIIKERWRIDEVLTARSLADEGRRMGHCVYSYVSRIEHGNTSIWSVQMEDGLGDTGRWHMVTLEVRNDLRRVVQARGRFNRMMTSREHQVVTRWAGANRLQLTLGAW